MDISSTLVGNSDQLDNVDLMAGPRDFTIKGVTAGNAEQPLNIALAEFARPWRPGLTMRRMLAGIWGTDAAAYVGRRVRLYRDDSVTFGTTKPGGTRISHASHIDAAVTLTLPTSRGKFGKFTVEPLIESVPTTTPKEPTAKEVAACTDKDALTAMWRASAPEGERRTQIEARVAALDAEPETPDPADELPVEGKSA